MAFCTNCGVKLNEGVKFCSNCGKAVFVEMSALVEPAIAVSTISEPVVMEPAEVPAIPKVPKKKHKIALVVGIATALTVVIIAAIVITSLKLSPKDSAIVFSVDLNSSVKVGTPISFSGGNSLANELQWLAVQIACIGIYNNAQTGDYTLGDPQDYYKPGDIRQFLTERSGDQTKTDMFYGICFNYAQAAYDDIMQYAGRYSSLGLTEWYIAAAFENSGQVVLFDTVPESSASMQVNGVYVKEASQHRVRTHANATYHAWLWVYGNDGEIYWIDPTWTDNTGYPWWGVVRNGEEVQLNPLESLCIAEIHPADDDFARQNRGNASKNKSEWDKAIEDYNEVIRGNPNDAITYYNRGNAYAMKRDFDTALLDFSDAIRLDPGMVLAYMQRGKTRFAMQAVNLRIDEGFELGWSYSSRKKTAGDEQAIADLTRAIELSPDLFKALYYRGGVYNEIGEYDRAIADYNEAIRLNPNYAVAYNDRGIVYSRKGDSDRAITEYSQAIRLDPNYAHTYMNRGLEYFKKGDYDRTIADCNEALRLASDYDSMYYTFRGLLYAKKKGDYDRAIADYTQAIRLDPANASVYAYRGYAYNEKRNYDQAIADYTQAVRLDPTNADYKEYLEIVRRNRGW